MEPRSPALQADALPSELLEKPQCLLYATVISERDLGGPALTWWYLWFTELPKWLDQCSFGTLALI